MVFNAIHSFTGERLWNEIQEIFTKTSSSTQTSYQVSFRDVMTDLRNEWNSINQELNSAKVHLEISKNRWEDYNISINNFEQWLNKMNTDVNEKNDSKVELPEMKIILEKYVFSFKCLRDVVFFIFDIYFLLI